MAFFHPGWLVISMSGGWSGGVGAIPGLPATMEPLYSGHPWDSLKCPDLKGGVLTSGIVCALIYVRM